MAQKDKYEAITSIWHHDQLASLDTFIIIHTESSSIVLENGDYHHGKLTYFCSHSQLRATVLVIDIVKDGGPLSVISRGENI